MTGGGPGTTTGGAGITAGAAIATTGGAGGTAGAAIATTGGGGGNGGPGAGGNTVAVCALWYALINFRSR